MSILLAATVLVLAATPDAGIAAPASTSLAGAPSATPVVATPPENGAAAIEEPPTGSLPDDVVGYQSLRWGMSLREVKLAEPELKQSPRGLWMRFGRVAGLEAVISPAFRNGQLSAVLVLFPREQDVRLTSIEKVDALIAALEKKYGPGQPIEATYGRAAKWANKSTTITIRTGPGGVNLMYEGASHRTDAERLSTDGL